MDCRAYGVTMIAGIIAVTTQDPPLENAVVISLPENTIDEVYIIIISFTYHDSLIHQRPWYHHPYNHVGLAPKN